LRYLLASSQIPVAEIGLELALITYSMIEATPAFRKHWEGLRFRDYLIAHSDIARSYAELKI